MSVIDWANYWHLEINIATGRWRIVDKCGKVLNADKTYRFRRSAQRHINYHVNMMLAWEKRQAAKKTVAREDLWVSAGDQK